MIKVDIVSPVGGLAGGVENVIKSWTRNLSADLFDLRVFHLHEGIAYLDGYEKAYCIMTPFEKADYRHLVNGYSLFINEYGVPDICIATNWPMMVSACYEVREHLGLWGMQIISWVHSKISEYAKENLGGITDILKADAHFAINGTIANEIEKADDKARIYQIGNPVQLCPLDGGDYDPYQLVYVGRLTMMKCVDVILEGIYRAKGPWRLKIIGDGEIREDIEGWVHLLGLDDFVTMEGWHETPWEICKDSGMLVMASEYEGFGLVAFEASSAGKTVISTPVDGIIDYIQPGVNGYLFPFGDAAALAIILDLLEEGMLPVCNSGECRKSVVPYSVENYFRNVSNILLEMYDKCFRGAT